MLTQTEEQPQDPSAEDFARQAESPAVGIVREFWGFLRYHKKWWLAPILLVLLLIGLLVFLGGTPLAPFIYTMW